MTTEPIGAAAVPPTEQPFEPATPEQAAEWLRGLEVPWYVAGGWALDLFIGRQTRAHGDIDISILRGDEAAIQRQLRGWEIVLADPETLTRWEEGQPLPPEKHAIFARQQGHERWQLEIVVEQREGTRWTYRRDPRIGLHVRDLGRVTAEGVPYIRPDVQLLYKSKQSRANAESDFLTVLPRLDPAARSFLAAGLWATAPGHRWLERLK